MTAFYNIVVKKSAEREMRGAPSADLGRIVEKLKGLAVLPRPHGCEKMAGTELYRIRQGDWRILYSVDDPRRSIVIYKIGHRREIYR